MSTVTNVYYAAERLRGSDGTMAQATVWKHWTEKGKKQGRVVAWVKEDRDAYEIARALNKAGG